MNRRRTTKRRVHPAVAVLLLLASASYSAWSLFGKHGDEQSSGLAAFIGIEDPVAIDDATAASVEEVRWRDLLAMHGSFDGRSPVRMAFAVLSDAAAPGAAPAVEVDPGTRWRGADPPMLRLGVVMVSAAARRAVLDGRVVGVGDQVAEGQIVAIEPGVVRLRWQQRELTYDLDGPAPREFRGELGIRRATGESVSGEEANSGAMEEGK